MLPVEPDPHFYVTRLLQTPQLHSSTPSLQPDYTTPTHTMLAFQLSATHLWTHSQIWPGLQLYAGCARLVHSPAEDLVLDNCVLAVLPSRPMLHCECT